MTRACRLFVLLIALCLIIAPVGCRDLSEDEQEPGVPETNPGPGYPGANDDNGDDDAPLVGTKYPIVLMHGFFGWGEAGPLSYFAGVQKDLAAQGFEVIDPAVSAIHSMEYRAGQWADVINAAYAGRKINIIAHSQGGLDARYMISQMGWGDRIASVTMIAVPNQGSALADYAAEILPDPIEWMIDWVLNLLGMDWDGIIQISNDYVRNEFNPANPDDPRVKYYSFQTDCGNDCFFLLLPTHGLLESLEGPNDGIVPTAGSAYGENFGVLHADHWSCIGQPAGLAAFDHKTLYREIAYGLRDAGF